MVAKVRHITTTLDIRRTLTINLTQQQHLLFTANDITYISLPFHRTGNCFTVAMVVGDTKKTQPNTSKTRKGGFRRSDRLAGLPPLITLTSSGRRKSRRLAGKSVEYPSGVDVTRRTYSPTKKDEQVELFVTYPSPTFDRMFVVQVKTLDSIHTIKERCLEELNDSACTHLSINLLQLDESGRWKSLEGSLISCGITFSTVLRMTVDHKLNSLGTTTI